MTNAGLRARFAEEQIIAVLKEHEACAKTADLARKHGVCAAPTSFADHMLLHPRHKA